MSIITQVHRLVADRHRITVPAYLANEASR
jgi:hypothetical protein